MKKFFTAFLCYFHTLCSAICEIIACITTGSLFVFKKQFGLQALWTDEGLYRNT